MNRQGCDSQGVEYSHHKSGLLGLAHIWLVKAYFLRLVIKHTKKQI